MSVDAARLLAHEAIVLDAQAGDRTAAVRLTGQALVDVGAVEPTYVDAMLQREVDISTYVGEGVAIPHATAAGKAAVLRDALSFLRFPTGVPWDEDADRPVEVCIGIAAAGDGHVALLAQLAEILLDPERAAALRSATDAETVLRMLTPADDEDDAVPANATEGER